MTQPDPTPTADMDGAWKEAFTEYLEPFFALCLPHVHAEINWPRGFDFLDKELQKIVPQADCGLRSVDLLVRVWRRNGAEQWVLIHVEIQAQYVADFPERIFEYHYGIRDRYRRPVASFAVLADDNPFAVIILAHLHAMNTKGDPDERRVEKVRLIKSSYERWDRDEIQRLMRLIDWLVNLPKALELQVRGEIDAYEKEKHMPYIPTYERRAAEEGEARGKAIGLQEGIALGLRLKFGKTSDSLIEEVRQINDLDMLHRIIDSIERSSDAADVRRTCTA